MQMDFAYWLQIGLTVAPMIAVGGVLYEKVRQLEKRLDGNGDSVPGRCKVHAERLSEHDRRLGVVESEVDRMDD